MAGNLMAIDSGQVDAMVTAITEYQTEANNSIQTIVKWESKSLQTGFFGEKEAATVKTYLDETCAQIGRIITFFEEFLFALEEVKEDYKNKADNATTTNVEEAKKRQDIIKVNRFGA